MLSTHADEGSFAADAIIVNYKDKSDTNLTMSMYYKKRDRRPLRHVFVNGHWTTTREPKKFESPPKLPSPLRSPPNHEMNLLMKFTPEEDDNRSNYSYHSTSDDDSLFGPMPIFNKHRVEAWNISDWMAEKRFRAENYSKRKAERRAVRKRVENMRLYGSPNSPGCAKNVATLGDSQPNSSNIFDFHFGL